MIVITTPIPDLLILEPKVFGDDRGFFFESFNQNAFDAATAPLAIAPQSYRFVQDNHSKSSQGVLRGLHYQLAPRAQGKLVRVIQGEVWDVAVDIRENSATRGQWFGLILSGDNKRQLWIPPGFAHGFVTLSSSAEFLYKTTDFYSPEHEQCIAWNDPHLAIDWPLASLGQTPVQLSAKDQLGRAWK